MSENSIGLETTEPQNRPKTIEEAIDALPRTGLPKWGVFALFLTYFFGNYENAVFAITIPGMRSGLDMTNADFAWPVAWNLIGFAVGAFIIGYLADKYGRQLGLKLTFVSLGVGGLLSGLAWDAGSLSLFRFIAGCGMGAVLALCTGYIGEMSPSNKRGLALSRIALLSTLLISASSFASLPLLSGAPVVGWRIILGVGGLVILLVPFVNRRVLPESPRWLAEKGRTDEAADIVRQMEKVAGIAGTAAEVKFTPVSRMGNKDAGDSPLKELLGGPLLPRLLMVLGFWFLFYLGFYGFNSYLPIFLEQVGVETSDAVFITVLSRAMGIISALLVVLLIERIERRTLITGSVLLVTVGIWLVIAGWGDGVATFGTLLLTFGVGLMVAPAYTYTAEVFPTNVRGTAASICDGIGHLGGAVAPFVILPVLLTSGAMSAGLIVIAALLVAAVLMALGVRTRNRSLEEIA